MCFSPDLFSLYSEIMRSLEGKKGFAIGGRNINNIRYADDTVLIADSEETAGYCNNSEGGE